MGQEGRAGRGGEGSLPLIRGNSWIHYYCMCGGRIELTLAVRQSDPIDHWLALLVVVFLVLSVLQPFSRTRWCVLCWWREGILPLMYAEGIGLLARIVECFWRVLVGGISSWCCVVTQSMQGKALGSEPSLLYAMYIHTAGVFRCVASTSWPCSFVPSVLPSLVGCFHLAPLCFCCVTYVL